ncbi:MAG: lactate racemase domain-containing protein [Peptococcaceae bacterium]|nr:lactate racemase domain-containing protein [Peptococcaceae bacterium]
MKTAPEKVDYPKMALIRQKLSREKLEDVSGETRRQLISLGVQKKLSGGARIALTAGSRGISNIAEIIRAAADYVKECGGQPFVVPAMGSQGGATARGQEEVLEHYGITEKAMGCPICSGMEVVELGKTEAGAPVYFDRIAYEADGIIVINRIKPHTDFIAANESGVVKMVAIGLGNEKGCSAMHAYGLAGCIPQSCRVSLEKAPILGGLGIVENSRDETWKLQGIKPEDFLEEDARLLALAKEQVPHLPMDRLDLLIVKEIGKMFSGTGMDTKVIGRIKVNGVPEPQKPQVEKLVVLRLNPDSYGNALGIGLADITTKELVEAIDYDSMKANLIATTYLERGKLPVWFDTEKEAVDAGFKTLGNVCPREARVAVVENTLHLEKMWVSEKVLEELKDVEVLKSDKELVFDEAGRLINQL